MEKEDLIQQLMNAETAEEIQQILIQNGYEISDERSEIIKEVVKASSEYKSLSMDELTSVSGGATERDYATEGCAATVEPDSHCWGTDGGCFAVYIDYDHYPLGCPCPRCGAHTFYIAKKDARNDIHSMYACRTCGLYASGFDIYVSRSW